MTCLKNVKQCKNCPWRKDARVEDIPDYNPQQHVNLKSTIAPKQIDLSKAFSPIIKAMACHNSTGKKESYECVGWLVNQLNNNNIGLRIQMIHCDNASEIEVFGEQYDDFEDTIIRPN